MEKTRLNMLLTDFWYETKIKVVDHYTDEIIYEGESRYFFSEHLKNDFKVVVAGVHGNQLMVEVV